MENSRQIPQEHLSKELRVPVGLLVTVTSVGLSAN